MSRKINSVESPGKSSAAKRKSAGSKLGRNLIAGAKMIRAHVRGEIELPGREVPVPVDVKAIRDRVGMSQAEFADAFRLNRRTLQQWEQGKAAPDVAVRAYLQVIDRNPDAVVAALRPSLKN